MSNTELRWTNEAEDKLGKVPEGFMRNMTKQRIEEYARTNNISAITLETVLNVIETSRAGMGSMMGGDISGMPEHVKQMLADKSKNNNLDSKEDLKYFFCFVCNYAVPEKIPDKCPNCNSESNKFSILEPEYKTEAHTVFLKWSDNAIKYLEGTPDDYRKEMTKYEIEAFSRRNGYKVITRDVVEERLKVWEGISKKIVSKMEWEEEARKRVEKIPEHIRGMIIKETELFAQNAGKAIVTEKTLEAIREKCANTREFHVKWQ